MRIVIVLTVLAMACTKKNPEACCTDATDCMRIGLPNITPCDDGLLCRGDRCVEMQCDSPSDCDLSAPYCLEGNGTCSETCSGDITCPGLGRAPEDIYCVSGACVECRDDMDCPVAARQCLQGKCVSCSMHTDCDSGVCDDGRCVDPSKIAYVSNNGSVASTCEASMPCNTVEHALTTTRPFVLIDAATYSSPSGITISSPRKLIGRGSTRPVFVRSTDGPIFRILSSATLQNIEALGARGTTTEAPGTGIQCAAGGDAVTLTLLNSTFRNSARDGGFVDGCSLVAKQSHFVGNAGNGLQTLDSGGVIDACTFAENTGFGMNLHRGVYKVTNSFFVRNMFTGLELFSYDAGNEFEFNTVADNASGISCRLMAGDGALPNNLIVRNQTQTSSGICSYPNSIIDADAGPVKFKRPDAPPYDYHIQAGSSAIDIAGASTLAVDFDGEARPAGAANDVGADELH